MKRPLIGMSVITSPDMQAYTQRRAYAQAIWKAGGEVIFLPCNPDKSNIKNLVKILDGLLLPGGKDLNPKLYGEEMIAECGESRLFEDEYDMALVKEVVVQGKPVLGICRGMQIINVLYGGTLYQDIPTQYSKKMVHTRVHLEEENFHTVNIDEDSYLAAVLGEIKDVRVNTSHHQAVKNLAEGFKITAKSPDGTIEAMENKDASILCVQWHPERMQDMEIYRRLMRDFVDRCR